jgi:DNA-binding transcriptional ArsR family regulator
MKLDGLYSALSNETRRRIIEILACEASATAGRLATEFTMAAPAVSQHLTWLRETGFVQARYEGRTRIYSLNPAAIEAVDSWFARIRGMRERAADAPAPAAAAV